MAMLNPPVPHKKKIKITSSSCIASSKELSVLHSRYLFVKSMFSQRDIEPWYNSQEMANRYDTRLQKIMLYCPKVNNLRNAPIVRFIDTSSNVIIF